MTKLLVVDSEKTIGLLLKDLLQDTGYNAHFTSSEEEACTLYQKNSFDIILTDLKGKNVDDFPFIQQIKHIDPDALIIVITGNQSFESIQTVLRLGVFDYITKPFNIDEISFSINRAISYLKLESINKALMQDLERHNRQLEKVVKERTEGLQFLFNITREIYSTLGLREVIRIIVNKVVAVLNVDKCAILLFDKEAEVLVIKFSHGLDPKWVGQTRVKRGDEISGQIFNDQEATLIPDIEKDSRFQDLRQEAYYSGSFICVPLVIKGELVGLINVNDKKTKEPLTNEDFEFVKELASEASIAIENAHLYDSLKQTSLDAFMVLTSAIDDKDHYTKKHSLDVTKVSLALAEKMGLSENELTDIRRAALLHDIGKIGIHDDILIKKEDLTESEWTEMRSHPLKGGGILRPLYFLENVIAYIEQHHEWYDGTGYPQGLKGEQISLGARIISVADSFCAMITERPHRQAFTRQQAIEEIKRNKGSQFFPEVVDVFVELMSENPDLLT